MKTTLSCDHVFDILTRGPFPAGSADDESVERHLEACHDCRRLAEALQPAVALFHETVADDSYRDLPEYRGRWAKAPHHPRLSSAVDALHAAESPADARTWGLNATTAANVVRVVSGGLLAVSLSLVVWTAASLVGKAGPSRGLKTAAFGPVQPALGGRTYLALAALNVPRSCLPFTTSSDDAQAAVPPADQRAIRCCTECHAAAHPRQADCRAAWNDSCRRCHEAGAPARLATRTVAVVRQACEVCHDG